MAKIFDVLFGKVVTNSSARSSVPRCVSGCKLRLESLEDRSLLTSVGLTTIDGVDARFGGKRLNN